MKNYKVVSLSVGGSSNRIFHAGDEVKSDAFPLGHAEKLAIDGHLQLIETETKQEFESFDGREFGEWKIGEVKSYLKKNEIEFDTKSNKASLYALMIKG